MTVTHRRPLSEEQIEARIEMRVAHLRVLAAQTAVEELPVLSRMGSGQKRRVDSSA